VQLVFKQELDIKRRTYGADTVSVYDVFNQAGRFFRERKKFKEAADYYAQARDVVVKKYGPTNVFLYVPSLNNLATVYHLGKNDKMAESLFKEALAVVEKDSKNPDPFRIAETLERYADFLQETNRAAEAEKARERARDLREKARS
jgi:tetratricopeptide (TPR) repeat protein